MKVKDILKIENHYDKYFTLAGLESNWDLIGFEEMGPIVFKHYTPTEKFPYHIVATMGMSDFKMPIKKNNR